jgi:hypothetical protein
MMKRIRTMAINQKLTNWVRMQILSKSERKGRCVEMVLKNVTPGKKPEEVESWEVIESPREEDAEALSDLIDISAMDDANGFGGLQKFSVSSYFEKTKDRVGARFVFRQIGEEEGEENPSEESDIGKISNASQIGMYMRHTERLHTTLLSASANTINNLTRALEGYQKQDGDFMRMRMDLMEGYQDMLDRKKGRELEERAQEFKEESTREVFQKVLLVAPHLINKWAGKKLLPEPANALSSLGEFRKSITQDEVEKICSVLPPEKVIALMEILQGLEEEGEEKPKRNGTNAGKH